MEPEVVANYLKYVNTQANAIFLQETMDGKEIAKVKGYHGVLQQTRLEDYTNGLTNFRLVDLSSSLMPIGNLLTYSDSFWKRIN